MGRILHRHFSLLVVVNQINIAGGVHTAATRLEQSLGRSPHAQRIRYSIDVVKPRRNQRNLQNGFIVKSHGPQAFVILRRNLCGIPGKFHNVIQHRAFWLSYRSGRVILLQRFD